MRSKFGWSLPPGCTHRAIDEEGPCAVCARSVDDCVCGECPKCGEVGNPRCYAIEMSPFCGHGMRLTREQVVCRETARLKVLRERVREQELAMSAVLVGALAALAVGVGYAVLLVL